MTKPAKPVTAKALADLMIRERRAEYELRAARGVLSIAQKGFSQANKTYRKLLIEKLHAMEATDALGAEGKAVKDQAWSIYLKTAGGRIEAK